MLTPLEVKLEYLLLKHLREQNILINYETVDISSEFIFWKKVIELLKKIRFFYIMVDMEQLFFLLFSKTNLLNEIVTYMNSLNHILER